MKKALASLGLQRPEDKDVEAAWAPMLELVAAAEVSQSETSSQPPPRTYHMLFWEVLVFGGSDDGLKVPEPYMANVEVGWWRQIQAL